MKKILFLLVLLASPTLSFTTSHAAQPLPCWLSGLSDGFGDDGGDCEIPSIILDPTVSDKVKDQFVCDTMHQYDASYVCPQYVYDANGMLVRDANGNVIIQPTTHRLPKTGNELFILIPGLIFVLFGTALILFPKKKRG